VKQSAVDAYRRQVQAARRAHRRGDRGKALELYRQALKEARLTGSATLEQRAHCDVSGALIELERYHEAEAGLREILLRSRDGRAVWQATFNLAIALRRQGATERATRFAHRAIDAARRLRACGPLARSLNLLGNLHLVESRFEEALVCYRKALRLYGTCRGDWRYPISIIRDNLGYCLLLRQRFEEGLAEIDAALGLAREVGHPRVEAECLQDRCYGLLRSGSLAEAEKSGLGALEMAERHAYRDLIVNCCYLLGELRHRQGDAAGRDTYFLKLQSLYPHLPFLRDFLCAFDVSGVINLKNL
jgi:tetratricopeptide (TPR) repeat protein